MEQLKETLAVLDSEIDKAKLRLEQAYKYDTCCTYVIKDMMYQHCQNCLRRLESLEEMKLGLLLNLATKEDYPAPPAQGTA